VASPSRAAQKVTGLPATSRAVMVSEPGSASNWKVTVSSPPGATVTDCGSSAMASSSGVLVRVTT
jgi:hypothetical protein